MARADASVKELLGRVLSIQERRAAIYGRMQAGFVEYLSSKSEAEYKEMCQAVSGEFNSCSREIIEIECALKDPARNRQDLADLLRTLQFHEKSKLEMTATLQLLKRLGHPSEREQHQMREYCGTTTGLEDCEAEALYLAAQKEAVNGIQDAVVAINDLLETIRYEIFDE